MHAEIVMVGVGPENTKKLGIKVTPDTVAERYAIHIITRNYDKFEGLHYFFRTDGTDKDMSIYLGCLSIVAPEPELTPDVVAALEREEAHYNKDTDE